jgi:hypothetical protein
MYVVPCAVHLLLNAALAVGGSAQDGVDCGRGCERACKILWPRPALELPDDPVDSGMVAAGVLLLLAALGGSFWFYKYWYPRIGPYVVLYDADVGPLSLALARRAELSPTLVAALQALFASVCHSPRNCRRFQRAALVSCTLQQGNASERGPGQWGYW